MPTVNPSTFGPKPQFELADGTPATGNKLFFYVAGSVNTKQATYTDSTGSVANANPVVLNSLGQPTTQLWFADGASYKVVFAPSTDTDPPSSPIWTTDNLKGINDTALIVDQWTVTGFTPTFVSTTSFTVPSDQTPTLQVGRRVRLRIGVNFIYGVIATSVFTTLTTVTVILDSGAIDATLSSTDVGFLESTNQSIPSPANDYQGADVPSSATTNLDNVSGNIVDITGTTSITAITLSRGRERFVRFRGALTLTNGANLSLPGGQNILTANGDIAIFRGESSSVVRCIQYILASGRVLLVNNVIQSISASVAASALTISASRLALDFRSATLGSGTVATIVGTPANLVISSGSTLGAINAKQSDIIVLALNNAGTIELAAVNISGGVALDEQGVISTTAEGGAGAADLATVVYSATARTSVAYRVLGMIRSTQATAGTWATAPSLLQGRGGNALSAMSSLAYGQKWTDVTGSRVVNTTYYNTTGKPIVMSIQLLVVGTTAEIFVDGVIASRSINVLNNRNAMNAIIPAGASYILSPVAVTFDSWSELR